MRRNARARPALHLFLAFVLGTVSQACSSNQAHVVASDVKTAVKQKPPADRRLGSSSAESERELSEIDRHIEDASAEVRRAEEELDRNLEPGQPKPQTIVPGPPAPPPKPAPRDEPKEGCPVACRALASMRRSTDYLCKLAGESDLRCVDARERVRNAQERVRKAACSCQTKVTRSFLQRDTSHATTW